MTRWLLAIFLVLISGCKFVVINVVGGYVDSQSGVRDCPADDICTFEVTDTDFIDSFDAVPDAGWEFVTWNSGGGFLCQNSKNPVCDLSNVAFSGNTLVESIIAGDIVFYIMPVFRPIPENYYSVGGLTSGLRFNDEIVIYDAVNDASKRFKGINGPIEWAFHKALQDGTQYDVSVTQQGLLSTCTILNASGVVSSANVGDIEVNCTGQTTFCFSDSDCPSGTSCNFPGGFCIIE